MRVRINRYSLPARVAGRATLFALLSLLCIAALDRTSNAGAAGHDVSIVDDDFHPGTLVVTTGDSVTWTNNGRKPHNVVALRGEWTSGRIDAGETFRHTFTDAGVFQYQCTIHWSMAGSVTVEPSASAGTGSAAQTAPAQLPPSTQPAAPRQFSPSFTIEGLVNAPRTITLEDLQALPSEEISVEFISGSSVEQRTYRGVLLHDLLVAAEPQFDRNRRNDMLRWYVTVSATDDYHAVIAWGEIDPGFEAKQVLVAYEEDGELLSDDDGMARLVVPGDQRGGRYVSNIVSIRLDRATAPE